MRTAVIIVTYNRAQYLADALGALLPQLSSEDNVFVIDNGSSDGTRELVPRDFPTVTFIESTDNVGGAGGFSYGVDLALALGYQFAWLMDDDGEPAPDAYQALMDARAAAPGAPMWTSTTWFYHGTVEEARLGEHLTAAIEGTDTGTGVIPAVRATFVGLLVNLEHARRQPLPIADFFIWHDDSEYTARLTRHQPGVRVLDSRIIHPFKAEYVDFGERLRFDIRNRLWILRDRKLGAQWLRKEELRVIPRVIAKQAIKSKRKSLYLKSLTRGLREGLFTRPHLDQPGELLQRWDFPGTPTA